MPSSIRFFNALTIAAASIALAAPARGALCPAGYDRQIRAAAETYLPGIPWRLVKAQLCAESGLDPRARSAAGAEGLAQFMPATWAEVARALGLGAAAPAEAGPAIRAAAFYMARQRRFFALQDLERHRHAVAAYNAGAGNVLKAWRLCGAPPSWAATVGCLDEVTGRHWLETASYVHRIFDRYWPRMEAGG
jgi:soluble lytic murein transglycosylase-like protein